MNASPTAAPLLLEWHTGPPIADSVVREFAKPKRIEAAGTLAVAPKRTVKACMPPPNRTDWFDAMPAGVPPRSSIARHDPTHPSKQQHRPAHRSTARVRVWNAPDSNPQALIPAAA